MKRTLLLIPALALALSGCFIVSKKPSNGTTSQSSTSAPKNHGQERSQEVHERNAERKAEHDAEKDAKKK
jgi:starvation-inducible outer membrane lipoprotein